MTALVFIGVLIVGYFLPYQIWPAVFDGHLTKYVAIYAATALTAISWAVFSPSATKRTMVAAGVLVAYWALCYPAWGSSNPLLAHAALSAAVAAYFVLGGVRRWELVIGGIFIASMVCGFAAWVGILATGADRPMVYVALTAHPDWLSILGHMGSIALGAAAGDGGLRIRDYLGYRAMGDSLGSRGMARVRTLAQVAQNKS